MINQIDVQYTTGRPILQSFIARTYSSLENVELSQELVEEVTLLLGLAHHHSMNAVGGGTTLTRTPNLRLH